MKLPIVKRRMTEFYLGVKNLAGKRKTCCLSILIICLILLSWISGAVPRQVGKITAINYVQKNHADKHLEFRHITYSSAHGSYFAEFESRDGEIYSFELHSKYFPAAVWFDPLNPPG